MLYDVLIINGKIVDGTGNPWFKADIGIQNGRIVEIGRLNRQEAKKVLDVEESYVSPGFIDIHSHSDLTLPSNPSADNRVRQGITTEVGGNCGMSLSPISERYQELLEKEYERYGRLAREIPWNWHSFEEYLNALEEHGIALNLAQLVGHGTLRMSVMGIEKRLPTEKELDKMKDLLAESMEAGAFGMSTGLVYPPGCYSNTEELIELCKVVAQYGGIYTSHIRGERETIVEALKEAIKIGEKAGIPVQVSHNCPKYGAWHRLNETLPLYDVARANGIEVTLDNDTHTDFGTYLWHALPQWAYEKGIKEAITIIKNPKKRERIKREIEEDKLPGFGPIGLLKHNRWERIVIYQCKKNTSFIGKNIKEIAKERRASSFDTFFNLIMEEKGEIKAIFDYMNLDDIRTLLKHPLMMICSDGQVRPKEEVLSKNASYFPCCFGEYPYVLERFVREEKLLTLQEAIRKMTSFPAQKLGLWDRGIIRKGMWADLTIFNLERMKDKSTNLYPHSYPFKNYPPDYPEGIDYVFINGEIILENGKQRDILPGKILRKNLL
ncbi:D-aminoacylase [Candidatus Aerophobetes bacterium]|nr:D-aminoacylase [Candidatus Aerophobetes bacterium]